MFVLLGLDPYNTVSRMFVEVNHLLLSGPYLKWHAMFWCTPFILPQFKVALTQFG